MRARFRRLAADATGAAALEFALVGPAMIIMMFGVLQVGLALQNYNALRNASAEVARYALVQYATCNGLNDTQLSAYARTVSHGPPYLLSDDRLITDVQDAAPRVVGASEKTLTMEYRIPSLLDSMGVSGPYITYSRPLFLTTPGGDSCPAAA